MRILTWNMQGGDKLADLTGYLERHKVDVACLQECGRLPPQYRNGDKQTVNNLDIWNGLVMIGSDPYAVKNFAASSTGAEHERCSLAILSRLDVQATWAVSLANTLRPLIGIKVPGELWIYTVHAPSNISAAAVSASLLDDIPLMHRRYVCVGDWNCGPSQLSGYQCISSRLPTQQSGGTIDYAVAQGVTVMIRAIDTPLVSDHYSQVFEVA